MPGVSPGPPVSSCPLTHPFTLSGCRGPLGARCCGQTVPLPRAPAPLVCVWGRTDSLEVWSHVHTLGGRGRPRVIRAPCDVRLCGFTLQCCPWPPHPHSRTFCGVSRRVPWLRPSWIPRAHLWSGLLEPRPVSRQRPSVRPTRVCSHPQTCVPAAARPVLASPSASRAPQPVSWLSQEQWEAAAGF